MSDDAGDQPPPAGPVSPEVLRSSVSLPEALEVFAETDTLQKLADLAHRFAQLHDGVLPDAHLKSCGGDFVNAANQLSAGEHHEAFCAWYEQQRYVRKGDVERKLQCGELFAFGCPETLANDRKWIPTRVCAVWCEIRGDRLAVAGGREYFDVRVVTAVRWREVASQSPAPPPQVPPRLKARTRGKGRAPAPHWDDCRVVAQTWMRDKGVPQPGDGRQAALERHITKWLDEHEHNAGESTIRSYVGRWIEESASEMKIEARKSGATASKERLPKR